TLDNQSLLGDNADLDDLDDGIMVKNANNASEDFKDLQNYQFENRQTYTFRVYPNSTVDGKIGYLHGWMSLNKAINNTTNDFDMGLKITDEAKVDNETVGFPNGIPLTVGLQPTTGELYYDFNYTVPDKTIANASANLGGNKSQAFFRFRFLPNETPNLNATNPPANSTLADTQPWVAEGEVEDYKIVYFYNFTPPLVGNVTIYNSDGSKNLYSRVANSTFNVKVVYLDKDGREAQPPAGQDLRADIKFEPDGSSPIDIVSGFKVTNKENELSINNLNIATRSGKFKIEYYLASNSGTKKPSESTIFGIRPDKFTLQGIGTAKLIGGKYEDIEIVAAKYNSTDATPGYNQAYNNISESLALVDCAKDVDKVEFITSGLGIFAGGSIKGNIKYNNVGKLNIKLTDNDWLNNDKDKKLCIEGDFTTNNGDGKIGCDIVLDEKTIEFVPEQFKGSLTLRNINSGEFTYISNNTRANEAMYATANVNIKALIAGGGTATNYDKECYANDVNWTLRLTNSKVTNTAISFYRVDTKKADIINANGSSVSSIQNQEVAVKTNANNFENGIANNIQVGFNFERLHNTPQNPFKANVGDFNITEIKDSSTVDSTSSSDTSSVLFVYGRVHSENYSNYSPITAILAFEGYCDNSCNVANYPPLSSTLRTKQWYRIMSHNGAIFGSVTELVQTKTGITINPTTVTGANGVGTSILACDDDHHNDDIKVHTQSWLLYNESNKFVDYNQFKIQFIGDGGSWAGVGQVSDDNTTGRVVPSSASERVRNKIGW
ncbi:MAG: hypothetical protein LBG67_00395, partial [Campylobacteraceae bacterium]|nr:hypothetical protein [Campylobacteraceae bacterium]